MYAEQMINLVLAWIAVVLAVYGVAYWRLPPLGRAPVPWLVALVVSGLCLWQGAIDYSDAISDGAYTGATLLIPIVPVKALFLGSLGYGATRYLIEAARKAESDIVRRWGQAAALTVVFAFFGGSEILGTIDNHRARTAASDRLTPADVAIIAERVTSGTAGESELLAFLRNPLCPSELLPRFADGTQFQKTAVAQNPNLTSALAVKLAQDADPMVRLYVISNASLPVDSLIGLSNDTDASVRARTAWMKQLPEADLLRLAADPDDDVRNTVANQDRLSSAALKALLADPSPRVRATAERKASYRTLD